MALDVMATQGARASVALVKILLSRNTLIQHIQIYLHLSIIYQVVNTKLNIFSSNGGL